MKDAKKHPLYTRWNNMNARCTIPSSTAYKDYGAKGITVCDRWKHSFDNFIDDVYDNYLKHLKECGHKNTTLDRINYLGDYSPENCRWATIQEQSDNKRPRIEYSPRKLSWEQVKEIRRKIEEGFRTIDLAKEYGVSDHSIYMIKKKRHWNYVG